MPMVIRVNIVQVQKPVSGRTRNQMNAADSTHLIPCPMRLSSFVSNLFPVLEGRVMRRWSILFHHALYNSEIRNCARYTLNGSV
jgi:hypothetical protein